MPYYRVTGEVPRKRHIRFHRPDGELYSEELMGEEGFSSDSSLLYHVHLPTAIVKSEGMDDGGQGGAVGVGGAEVAEFGEHGLDDPAGGVVLGQPEQGGGGAVVVEGLAEMALAIDLVESECGLLVIEVNATMEFRNSIAPTGVDIPDAVVDYVLAAAAGFAVPSANGAVHG